MYKIIDGELYMHIKGMNKKNIEKCLAIDGLKVSDKTVDLFIKSHILAVERQSSGAGSLRNFLFDALYEEAGL